MADNTSHTDDRADARGADNRTPPPGIEVIGELPPGTPWWDAEQLGLTPGWFKLIVWSMYPVLFLAILTWNVLSTEDGSGGGELMLIALFVLLLLILLLIGLHHILRPLPVVMSSDMILKKGLLHVEEDVRLSELYSAVVFTDGKGKNKFGVEAKRMSGRPGKGRVFISNIFLGVKADDLSTLLTYRIAKAKGENPPPPEFS